MEIPYTVKARPDTGLWNAKIGIWLFLASEVMLFGGLFSAYIFLRLGSWHWPHGVLNIPIGLFNTFVLITSSVTMVFAWASLKMRNLHKYEWYMGITIFCGFIFLGVKSYEYYEKFHHYGIIFKNETIADRYRDEVKAAGGQIKPSIIEGQFEVTGHIEEMDEQTMKFVPDSIHSSDPMVQIASVLEAITGKKGEHGEAVTFPLNDVYRWGPFAPRYSSYFAIYFTLTALHALHVIGGMAVMAYFWLPGRKLYHKDPEHLANRVEVVGLFWHFVDLVWIFLFPVLYLL